MFLTPFCAASAWPAAWCAGTRTTTATARSRRTPWTRHFDAFVGRGAALDVFGHILEFLGERV
ncbi:hypothetical protein [Streptomyces formicae]